MAAAVIANLGSLRSNLERVPTWLKASVLQLPPADEQTKHGYVHKRVLTSEGVWHRRRLVLTEHFLYVAREDSTDVLDQIPLVDILSVDFPKSSGSFFKSSSSIRLDSDKSITRSGSEKKLLDAAKQQVDSVQPTRTESQSAHSPKREVFSVEKAFEIQTKKDSVHMGRK